MKKIKKSIELNIILLQLKIQKAQDRLTKRHIRYLTWNKKDDEPLLKKWKAMTDTD